MQRNHLVDSQLLHGFLCQSYALFTEIQGARWNYSSPDYLGLQKLLDEQYHNLHCAIDKLADRLRALGQHAPQNMKEILEGAGSLACSVGRNKTSLVANLIERHQALSERLAVIILAYENYKDHVTYDILVERKYFHDKALWMLKSIRVEAPATQDAQIYAAVAKIKKAAERPYDYSNQKVEMYM